MTISEQVKRIDKKIEPNKAQYDLDKQAAKISACTRKIFGRKSFCNQEI